jgi:hypothetical protein
MKASLLACLLLAGALLPPLAQAQRTSPNLRLKHELDSLYYVDQVYRAAMFASNKQHLLDSMATAQHLSVAQVQQRLISLMVQTDSSDLRRVEALIQRYGYPGKTLVGTPTNEAAFYVLQHSTRIPQYLPLIKRAADQGELPFRLYAMMLDRQLMNEGKPQIYGTQGRAYNGQPSFIWPIEDPAHVNERRKKAGFDLSVEDNAKRLDIPYKVLTLEDIRKLPGYQPVTH